MCIINISVDGSHDIEFSGVLIASESTSDNATDKKRYSGKSGVWTELYLYKTRDGRYVCARKERTKWVNQKEHSIAKFCYSIDEIKRFFGDSWIANELYKSSGIETAVN